MTGNFVIKILCDIRKFMNNPQILEIIENLKGRRAYEEKRASKLGFSSLYAYIEDIIMYMQTHRYFPV